MNLIVNLNNVIDYIEENLTQYIELDELAKITNLSYYHFSRVFSAISEIGVSEYIRCRRLSESAIDVTTSKKKIISIALEYQYNTPEAFSKAFKAFHGVSPMSARTQNYPLTHFPKLLFEIQISSERAMKYKIITHDEITLIGRSARLSGNYRKFDKEVKKMWENFISDGYFDKVSEHMIDDCLIGIIYNVDTVKEEFSYLAGVRAADKIKIEGVDTVKIPKSRYVVFERTGTLPSSLEQFKNQMFMDWFPNSKYEILPIAEIEVYFKGSSRYPSQKFEYWVSVK